MERNYGNNILVDFESIVDIDLGIINYILLEYSNSKYLKPHVVNGTEYFIKALLLTRELSNPLSIIFKNEYASSIDGILQELEETKYEEILKLSTPTSLFGLIQTYKKTDGVLKCTIMCKNSTQEQYIKKFEKDFSVIVSESVDLRPYDTIMIKTYSNILKHQNLDGKSILVSEYRYNLKPGAKIVLDPKIDALVSKVNNVYLIAPYANFKLPKNTFERKVVK